MNVVSGGGVTEQTHLSYLTITELALNEYS